MSVVTVILHACRRYDEGCVMVKLGREEPVASMDNSGKIIWAKHNEIQTVNIKSLGDVEEVGFVLRRLRSDPSFVPYSPPLPLMFQLRSFDPHLVCYHQKGLSMGKERGRWCAW